jgi:predicted metal-dependent HD superfamily phosphohydrolase
VINEASLQERWRETWALAGLPTPEELLRTLVARYREPQRAYHGIEHVMACLEASSRVRAQLDSPPSVELALWYHDVVYEPRKSDNEERSAELAAAALRSRLPSLVPMIQELILATKHNVIPVTSDARYVVDIDLAILGATPEAFDDYEAAVRREYQWVPELIFRSKRREILQSFLDRHEIFLTDHFRELEQPARTNLRRSVSQLS